MNANNLFENEANPEFSLFLSIYNDLVLCSSQVLICHKNTIYSE